MTQITASYVADRLVSQVDSFVRELLPNGKKEGSDWVVGSLDGEAGKSLKIHLTGEHAGSWRDWATSDHGDLLDLFAKVKNCDISTAIDQCCTYLNIHRTQLDSAAHKTYQKPKRPDDVMPVDETAVVFNTFAARGITQKSVLAYKVVADGDSRAVYPFFKPGADDPAHLQMRNWAIPKRESGHFYASEGTELILFGWQAVPPRAREIVITEGPMDAMAWYEYGFPALSVPNGGGGNGKQKWIESEHKNLERFDKIYVCMDKDQPGEEATKAIVERLGRHRCFVINVPDPHKDVNDCLMHKVPKDVIEQCVRDAKTVDPSELRNASYFADEVVEHFNPNKKKAAGFSPPWPLLANDVTFGFGQTSMIAGWNGSGKTTIVGQITLSAIAQGVNACVASLEFKSHTYLAWLVRQATCMAQPDERLIRASISQMAEHLWAFGAYGSASLDKILDVWDYAYSRYGCKLFVLDNFSKLHLGDSKDDNNNLQNAAITKLTEFAVNHGSHVIVLAHSRKKFNEHEEVGKLDIKGSGTLTDLVDIVMLLHRNKKKERAKFDRGMYNLLPVEEQAALDQQPDAYFTCEKNRHGEVEPRIQLWFDKTSHQYVESSHGLPTTYTKPIG